MTTPVTTRKVQIIDATIAYRIGGLTPRYLATQLDPANQAHTRDLAASLAGFHAPTLILWGEQDVHFPPAWARRLQGDPPGAERVEILPGVGHLLMEERPAEVAALIGEFLTATSRPGQPGRPPEGELS